MSTSTRSRAASAFAAAAIAVLTALSFAAPASAAPVIDPDETGSITIHKFDRPESPTGLPNNGTEVDTTGLTPLEGITFRARQVQGLDLSTNAGLAAASDLAASFNAGDPEGSITAEGYTLSSGTTQTTGADGEALFGGLPVGVYVVEETGYGPGITPSVPFVVTVPLTDPNSNDTWLYDVHVYPKNSTTAAEKTVTDATARGLGDEVRFTIATDIPNESVIDGYRIVDTLDAKLDYVSTAVALESGTALGEGTDYTIGFDEATNSVRVEFTAAGRAVLAANNSTRVIVNIITSANAIGEIENQAVLYPNAASFDAAAGDPGGPVLTPTVETRWGGMTLQKAGTGGEALTGAKFAIFTSEADALAQTNAVSIDGVTEFEVTATSGELTINGLRYSDFANGATVAEGDPGFIRYYLVETQSPDGYELLAQPVSFLVNAASTATGIDMTVTNVPSNAGFQLPLTGGTGTGLLYLAGGVLVVGGAALFIVSRARRARA
ncbi:SpaH/EbpB family LPXTG-anchored major pilin [Microbacterium arborescens]|uniref:SpaH/EbpB family LPXTG-anchored major pilin n=1 Tax=Microbacterium arborescens TaxID=33883 RepID=UPI0025A0CBB2|nr:SpaH/EbpB family LPXTG-anchored major pilin [Microbacterium arborescens]WJM15654.1 SpaH/EbpB family LPXTG-anchored major pilin [Microbacterium arborescens]